MKKQFLFLVAFVVLCPTAQAAPSAQDKSDLTETIAKFLHRIDEKKFDEVEAMISKDAVSTAVFGGQPQDTKTAHAIVEEWRKALTPVKAVHHQAGNFVSQVHGNSAHMTFYAIAYWYRPENPNPVTLFVGDYDYEMARDGKEWKITKLRYNNKFVNPPLK